VLGVWLLDPVWPLVEDELAGDEADVALPLVCLPDDCVVDGVPMVDWEPELPEVDWIPELEADDDGVDCVWVDVDCACSARVAAKSAAAPDDTSLSELFMCNVILIPAGPPARIALYPGRRGSARQGHVQRCSRSIAVDPFFGKPAARSLR
jgi:hypothetical protein